MGKRECKRRNNESKCTCRLLFLGTGSLSPDGSSDGKPGGVTARAESPEVALDQRSGIFPCLLPLLLFQPQLNVTASIRGEKQL